MDVLHHLKTLYGDLDNNESVKKALRAWYEQHKIHVEVSETQKFLVTAAGKQENDEGTFLYYDNIANQTFSFNPFTLEGKVEDL